MMTTADQVKRHCLIEFLQRIPSSLERDSGFVQRQSKLTGSIFAQSMILGSLKRPDASLNDFAQCCGDLGVEITPAGFDARIGEAAAAFMKSLFEVALTQFRTTDQILPSVILNQFSGIYLTDSTQMALPANLAQVFPGSGGSAPAATLKVILSFDYLHGQMNAIETLAGRQSDQNTRLFEAWLLPNTLHLFDLGFVQLKRLAAFEAAHAFFICRLPHNTTLYTDDQEGLTVDVLDLAYSCHADVSEWSVYVRGQPRLAVRLILRRVTEAQRQARLKALTQEAHRRCRPVSQRQIALAAWNIYITNVPNDRLTTDQVTLCYRLRWQIELIFKLWKSQAQLACVKGWRAARLLSQLYARLIGVVIFHWLAAPLRIQQAHELSLPKAFRIFQNYAGRLLYVFAHQTRGLTALLAALMRDFLRFARKTCRRKSPSSYQRVSPFP